VAATIALAYHNLSIMLAAGVPMLRSLNTVASGLDRHLQAEFLKLADAVTAGSTIAQTMSRCPRIFDPLDVMIIHAAETSGSLPELLDLLSKWHELCQRIARNIHSGMLFPIVQIHLTALLAPLPTFFLGGRQTKPYLFSVICILLLFYIPAAVVYVIRNMTPKTGPLRTSLDRLTIKIPVLGKAVYKMSLSRYCWVFHMLLKAGLPITDSAEKAAAAAGNAVVADQLRPGAASAKAGSPVSAGFSRQLPTDFLDIWRIGEETGLLDDVTKRLADSNAEAGEFLFTEFARWLPRLVYVLICLLIICFIFRNFAMVMSAGL